jgi:ABC-type transporter Mla maintaining outer membrane lipid asymmetry ATPase subunit MlaF
MSAARKLADHAAVIHEGRITESGTAAEVFGSHEPVARQLIAGDPAGPVRLRDP